MWANELATGSTILMTPIGDEPVELRIAEAAEPDLFVDEARIAQRRIAANWERLCAQVFGVPPR
jgi:hypothetical protein